MWYINDDLEISSDNSDEPKKEYSNESDEKASAKE